MIRRLPDFISTRTTSKAWITPENEVVTLSTWHYEYFRDNAVSAKYGVPFGHEVPIRIAALRVGFVRVNYERNGGLLTFESMRWDRKLRMLINEFVIVNADAIDNVRMHIVDGTAQLNQLGVVSPMSLRAQGSMIDRRSLGSWNNFRPTKPSEQTKRLRKVERLTQSVSEDCAIFRL